MTDRFGPPTCTNTTNAGWPLLSLTFHPGLNVHLDKHAFDAELYADELGLSPERTLLASTSINPEDVRSAYSFWFEFLSLALTDIMF